MKQATNKKNTARLTAALFALILLFPCCMDSGSGGSSDYDSGSNTENNGSQENPDEPDAPENPDELYSADVESSVVVNLDGTCAYNSSTANFFLDFSENGFGETIYQKLGIPYGTATSESNAYFEWDDYGKAFNLPSNYRDCIKTDEYDRHIEIDGVDFLEKPFYYYVWPESYGGNIECSIPKAFVFGEEVSKVDVSFGKEHNLIDAYKGGIILKNPAAKITSSNIGETNLTGALCTPTIDYDKKLRKFNENTLISYLYTESNLPNLSFAVNFFNISPEEDNFFDIGIDKLFENYYRKNASDKISMVKAANIPFDAEEYLNGDYMYGKDGSYNDNAYDIDINIALLMAEKLTNNLKNINVSGNLTSDVETSIIPRNVRFSGDVSGLTFTKTGYGLIDFADVGSKWIAALNSKIIVNGLKNDGVEKGIFGYAVDFSNVDESLLNQVSVKDTGVDTVYTKTGSFSGSYVTGVHFKSGSSASTNQAWEKKGRGETVSDDELISKLDVKAKADNPLLQKLLDENRPVYG